MFEVNVFGTMFCTKAAVSEMKKRSKGLIINIASTAALDFKLHQLTYGATKHAVLGFTGSLYEELKNTGIKSICFCPGGMKTNLYRRKIENLKHEFMDPEFVANYLIEQIETDNPEWLIVLRRPV